MDDPESKDVAVKPSAQKNLPVSLTLEHVSPVTRLLEKRKQMLQVQESLDMQKDEYSRKEELFKRREENLRKKDLELQEALVLFNKFLKENEQKRRRAEMRTNEEIKKKLKWEKEITNRKITVEKLKLKCKKLRRLVEKNDKYQSFLQLVYDENTNHFDEIASIIARYNTLKITNQQLIADQAELLRNNEILRQKFAQYKKDQYNTTLSLNNDIASYSRELEACVKQTSVIEDTLIEEEEEESKRKTTSTQIILAADNLFLRCRKVLTGLRRHVGMEKLSAKDKQSMDAITILKEETCDKLDEIGTYLIDFDQIVEQISGQSLRNNMKYGQRNEQKKDER